MVDGTACAALRCSRALCGEIGGPTRAESWILGYLHLRNPYEILGIPKTASAAEIRKAYHALAKESHPDLTGEETEAYKEASAAYSLLSNPQRRAHYDEYGQDAPEIDSTAKSLLIQIFMTKLNAGASVTQTDLILEVRKAIDRQVLDFKSVKTNTQRAVDRNVKVIERLQNGELFVEALLRDNDEKILHMTQVDLQLKIAARMTELLEGMHYRCEKVQMGTQTIGNQMHVILSSWGPGVVGTGTM